MADLADALAGPAPVNWITATVAEVQGDAITLDYLGSLIPDVAVLDSYTPQVGDSVHALSRPQQGILVLGSSNAVGGSIPEWTPGSSTVITPGSVSTWNRIISSWAVPGEPIALIQDGDNAVCWFYRSSDLQPWDGVTISAAEMELTLSVGADPAEMFLHQSPGITAPLAFDEGDRFTGPILTPGAATWVPIPLDWIQDMAAGSGFGIGIGLGIYANVWSAVGSGRLRITLI
jgi:hypothetical protein